MRALCSIGLALVLVAPCAARAQDTTEDERGVATPRDVAIAQASFEASAPVVPAVDPTLRDVHLALQIGTLASLALTASLGVIAAYNQETVFSDGQCNDAQGDPIFGFEYGCEHLSTLHGIAGVTTTTLYTASIVTGAMMPEQDDVPQWLYDLITAVHVGGMVLLPLAGLLSAYPGVVGVDEESQQDFSKVLRTVHAAFAVTTTAAYVTTLVFDWT
ncbi:hypothetical protein [Sandaracinus amylolyticus]|uniref:hypothetical protein n=1 Tax=Sandaracinus amylolyticus TaxID=927083 RepID=UPI001F47814F|nr:hypothetical protein [Sandaracinus amylolyticus]UJR84089.1 Hypothetical protein I5071_61600 [Sandaracinus amylolyticus]